LRLDEHGWLTCDACTEPDNGRPVVHPTVRGWGSCSCYGAFYRSELSFLAWRINEHLIRWAMHKFKRFRGKYARAADWLQKVYQHQPDLFAHWQLMGVHQRPGCGGRMTGDCHVRS
jgi:hypothetical protein